MWIKSFQYRIITVFVNVVSVDLIARLSFLVTKEKKLESLKNFDEFNCVECYSLILSSGWIEGNFR